MKPRGRPRLDPADQSVKVSISLPGKQFDRYCAQASRDMVSLPELLRRLIDRPRVKITKK